MGPLGCRRTLSRESSKYERAWIDGVDEVLLRIVYTPNHCLIPNYQHGEVVMAAGGSDGRCGCFLQNSPTFLYLLPLSPSLPPSFHRPQTRTLFCQGRSFFTPNWGIRKFNLNPVYVLHSEIMLICITYLYNFNMNSWGKVKLSTNSAPDFIPDVKHFYIVDRLDAGCWSVARDEIVKALFMPKHHLFLAFKNTLGTFILQENDLLGVNLFFLIGFWLCHVPSGTCFLQSDKIAILSSGQSWLSK